MLHMAFKVTKVTFEYILYNFIIFHSALGLWSLNRAPIPDLIPNRGFPLNVRPPNRWACSHHHDGEHECGVAMSGCKYAFNDCEKREWASNLSTVHLWEPIQYI